MSRETIVTSNKYILLQNEDGFVIVDTGSPMSFHRSGRLSFGGISHACSTSIIGVNVDALSEESGLNVTGLLGMDIMNKYDNVLFDYRNSQIIVNDDRIDESNMIMLPSGSIMGIPYTDISIEGRNARVFVDTGAPISYISDNYTNGLTSKDRLHDYNPALGEFWTEIYDVRVGIGADTHVMPFGNLSNLIQMSLSMVGIDGIIGYELFSRYQLLYQNRHLYICNNNHGEEHGKIIPEEILTNENHN